MAAAHGVARKAAKMASWRNQWRKSSAAKCRNGGGGIVK